MTDDLLNDFLLEAFPNPERKGCPDDDALKAFAENRTRPGDPILSHIGSCSECYREYKHYRQDWIEAGAGQSDSLRPSLSVEPTPITVIKRPAAPILTSALWGIAAGLAVVVGGGVYFAVGHHPASSSGVQIAARSAPVSAQVDLFNAVTVRGSGDESTPLEQVSLPSSVVNLAVTLPRFSQSGPYEVLVSKDRAGRAIVAQGAGNAVETGQKVSLTVTLDLRNTAPGAYFLATVRGSDNGTYYYPLQVR